MHFGAFGCVELFLEDALLRLALITGIFFSLIWSIRHHILLHAKNSLVELNLKADGQIDGLTAGGKLIEARIAGQTTVLPWLVVLRLISNGTKDMWTQVLMPDALSPEDGRLLKVWLRWKSTSS